MVTHRHRHQSVPVRAASRAWTRVFVSLLLAAGLFGQGSLGQTTGPLPTRGVEEVGRTYIGEPLSAYIGHMAMLFVTGKHPTVGNGTMQDTVNWVNDPLHSVIADGTGGLAIYAHPDTAGRVLALNGLTGMELFSQGILPSSGRDQMWDSVLATLNSQGRPLIWAFAADDTHATSGSNWNHAWNVSRVLSNDVFGLKQALRTGAFYATNGPDISSVAATGTTITLNLAQPADVFWLRAGQFNSGGAFAQTTVAGANRAVKIDPAVISSSLNVSAIGVPLTDIQFVRAIVRTSSTRYALTQPFKVSSSGAISNPYPAGGTWIKGQTHNHDDAPIDNTTSITTYRNNYAAAGQTAAFETAYSYWEVPYQRLDSDGYPDVFSVSPSTVPYGAFTELTIQGVNFVDGVAVQVGPHALANITRVNATTLRASVPTAVPPGVYDLVVTNPDTRRGALALAVGVQESTASNAGWRSYTAPDLPWNQTTSIAAIGDEVWVGTVKGAAQIKNGVWSKFTPGPGLNAFSRGIYDITADPAGGIWFSSLGMWFRDAAGTVPWQFSSVPNASEQRWGRMAWDLSGQLWVTSRWSDGLAIRSPSGTWTHLTAGLPSTDTLTITRDQQGSMWVGFSGGRGIWKWNGSTWTNVPVPGGSAGLPQATFASALVTAPNGDVWAAVQPMVDGYAPEKSGVVRYIGGDSQSTQVFKTPQLPHARISDILVTGSGDVWFASRAGASRMNASGQWQTFTRRNSGLLSDVVMALAEDQAGNMWFATDKGVSSFSAFDFSLFNSGPVSIEPGTSGTSTINVSVTSPPVAPVSFSVAGLPADTTATFSPASCSPPCSSLLTVSAGASAAVGTYSLTVDGATATNGTRSTSLSLTIGRPNRPPVVLNPGSQANDEGDTVTLSIAGSDPDGDAVTYTATGLPAGLAIEPVSGIISGTIAPGAAFNNLATVTVSDPSASTASASFGWTVRAPVMPTRGVEEIGRSYIGEPVSAYVGHMAMLFVTGKHPTIGNGTMQDTVNWVNDPLHSVVADGRGGLAVYAHPDFADRVLQLEGLTGMEVFSKTDIPSATTPLRDQMWDVVNTTRSSQGKSLLWGFAADDSHLTTAGNFNFAWNAALLPARTLPALKDALRTGAFYISNGPGISAIASSGTTITLSVEQPSTVLWLRAGQYNTGGPFTQTTATGANRAVRIETGVTSSTLDVASLGLTLSDLRYVRAIVQTTNVTYALTQPLAVSPTGAITNPFPASGTWVKGQSHNHSDAEIGNTATIATFRANYQGVGQSAAFETAYSYWEVPYQRAVSDGFPDVASVSPASVRHSSGGRITINGVNFAAGLTVQLGSHALLDPLIESATVLSATVPTDIPPGVYDVVVTNADGYRGTLAGGFTVQEDVPATGGWRTYAAPNLPWDQTTSVTAIGDDVWVGTMNGAARYRDGAWSTFVPSGGLNLLSSAIYDIAADPSGGVWFTSTGLWSQDPAGIFPWSFQTVDNPSGLSERWGRMAFDGAGRLWVTSRWSEGIAILDPASGWSRLRQASGLPQDDNQVIARDAAGNMWVGFSAGQGIWKWDGSTWLRMTVPGGASGLPQATYASALTAASNGDVWAAVAPMAVAYNPQNAGVVRFKADGTTEIFKAPLLPHARLTDILVARSGDVWFSSRSGVSRRTAAGSWQTYTTRNSGLVSDVVMAIDEDADGNIWFATDTGVSVLSPNFVNGAPTVSSPGDQTTSPGSSVSLQISAGDVDHDALTFAATGLPAGLSINTVSGVISGSVASTAAETNTVTVTANDGTATGSATFTWTVIGGNRIPVVTNPGDQSSVEGASVTLPIQASDPDGAALSYAATGLPTGLTIDGTTGVVSGTVATGAPVTSSVVVTASDGSLSATATFTWTVTRTNGAPTVTSPGDQSSAEGASVTLPIQASDPDENTLTYSATGLPTGLTIDGTTGVISGTVAVGAAASNSVVVTASDGSLSGTATFTWTVTRTNGAPTVTSPGDQSSAEGASVTLAIQASDPDENTLTYSATGLPTGLTINAASGVISGTIGFGAPATNSVVVTASDGSLSGTATFTWTVTRTNRAPTVTSPGDQSSAEGATVTLAIQASDPDENTLTYSATGLPTGLTINATSGVISGTIGFGAPATNSVVVTASDGSLSGTATFTWTVTRTNRAPTVTSPGDQSSAEGATVTLAIQASDPDGNAVTYSASGLPTGLAINATSGVISGTVSFAAATSNTVVVTASDGSLSATTTFAWTVTNTNRAPSVTSPGNQTTLEGSAVTLPIGAGDPDGDTLTFSATGLPPDLGINPGTGVISGSIPIGAAASYSVAVTASDSVLNSTATFTWIVTRQAPSAPSGLVATPTSSSQISLTWSDSAANEDGFRIERSTTATGGFVEIGTVGPNVTTFGSSGLTGSTTYYFRVRAYNTAGTSPYSNVANATTLEAATPPAAPTSLAGTATSSTQITLTWRDNSGNEQGFLIERAMGNGAFVQVASTGVNVSVFTDAGLTRNTTYRYRVRAFNAFGSSAYTNAVSVKTRPK